MRKTDEGRSATADQRRPQPPRSGARERTLESHHADAFGPQGAALILELRRIQRAFDQEQDAGLRPGHAGRQPYDGLRVVERSEDHRAATGRKRKGMIRRAVESCLRQFAIGIAPLTHRAPRAERQIRPAPASGRPRDRQRVGHALPPREQRLELPTSNADASIELLRRLARDAERQLASGQARNDCVAEPPVHEMPAALSGGRVRATLVSGAKAGYRYLLGAEFESRRRKRYCARGAHRALLRRGAEKRPADADPLPRGGRRMGHLCAALRRRRGHRKPRGDQSTPRRCSIRPAASWRRSPCMTACT